MSLKIVQRSQRHGFTVLRILKTVSGGPPQVTYSVITPDGSVPLFSTRKKAEAFIDEAMDLQAPSLRRAQSLGQ
jgi:hypothetical protein